MGKKSKRKGRLPPNLQEAIAAKNASSKKMEKYTVDQLMDKAEEYVDQFEFMLAQKFCQRALEIEQDNIRALETSGQLLLELGDTEAAKQCFGRAIEVEPNSGHSKYMYMGQLMTGETAVQCFQKGIELMKKYMEELHEQAAAAASSGAEEPDVTVRDVSSAYCSMAEIYLTDECFGDEADEQCKKCLDLAISEDISNPEAHHLLASYWLSKDKQEKAKESMDKGVSLWLPAWKEAVEKAEGAPIDPLDICSISYPARINASKILIELKDFDVASEVLELLLDEEDEVVETWYLLGWLNYLQGQDFFTNARFYLSKAQKVAKATQCEDKDMVKHTEELLTELGPGDEDEEEEENAGEMEITSDIDSDNEDKEDNVESNNMEH